MRINWKKTIIITLDLVFAVFLITAFMAFDKIGGPKKSCNKVVIDIQDQATNGFITTKEVKQRLEKRKIYPLGKMMSDINVRQIEESLEQSPFVKNAECYKTDDGHVCISLTQRMPILRIKADNGEDYYIDDNHSIMPNSNYLSDITIATGHINKKYAKEYLSYFTEELMNKELWKNQIVQINVLPNQGIELVPRVGNHIVYIGQLPQTQYKNLHDKMIKDFIEKKMDRLEKFYKYGLSQAGWNKYSYINIEFDNQIICKKAKLNR